MALLAAANLALLGAGDIVVLVVVVVVTDLRLPVSDGDDDGNDDDDETGLSVAFAVPLLPLRALVLNLLSPPGGLL